MKKICKIILMVCSLMLLVALQRMSITALAGEDVTALLSYSGHVQTYGDLQGVQDGDLLGTTGESKRIEALSIQKAQGLQDVEGDIVYRVHVQSFGTQEWVRNGAMAGTKGQCKRIEAVQMYLTGELAEQYDIYYAVHCQTYGWSKWTKGSMEDTGWCGTSGLSKRVEAVRVLLVKKDEKPAMSQEGVFSYITLEGGDGIVYSGHQQTFGDLNPV